MNRPTRVIIETDATKAIDDAYRPLVRAAKEKASKEFGKHCTTYAAKPLYGRSSSASD